jgi:hypothetical protein
MKLKYKGKVIEAVVWTDGSIRSKDGETLYGFSAKGLIEGVKVHKDAPKDKDD